MTPLDPSQSSERDEYGFTEADRRANMERLRMRNGRQLYEDWLTHQDISPDDCWEVVLDEHERQAWAMLGDEWFASLEGKLLRLYGEWLKDENGDMLGGLTKAEAQRLVLFAVDLATYGKAVMTGDMEANE